MVVAFLTWFYLITTTASKVGNYSHFAGLGLKDVGMAEICWNDLMRLDLIS